ncbi:hypothetical protein [Lichenifustis flavocetrariae]|uniref:Type II secretion system protein GspC N-terminal domain-containing protein n=1 Tax=Lichenifustis flavocetrariae TaxID=2949735 RepID=A0AA41YUB8_9HYPH|nr:hypothetical protein [Lichenifustis flavocetrariae]MCW6508714.1 hypothetical protein [Lichenifustis flavocetrariae]
MIRFTFLLIRTSLPVVTFLTAGVMTLASILSGDPGDNAGPASGSIPSLAPLPKPRTGSTPAIAQHVALFDPGHRPETVSGSIDDLRAKPAGDAGPSPVAISGVLLSGDLRKAMLAVEGGRAAWSTVGSEVGGWHVTSIDASGAVLERDGQSFSLKVADRYAQRAKHPGEPSAPASSSSPDNPVPDAGQPPGAASDAFAPPDAIGAAPPP